MRFLKRAALVVVVVVVTLLAARVFETQRGPPLRPWHTYVPEELTVEELGRTDWAGYLKAEAKLFDRLGAADAGGAGGRGPDPEQPLLRREPDLPRHGSSTTGTGPTSSTPTGPRSARWCSCTG